MPIDIDTGCGGDESESNAEKKSFQKAESNGGSNHFSIEEELRTFPFAVVLVVALFLVVLIGLVLSGAAEVGDSKTTRSSSWTLMKSLRSAAGAEPRASPLRCSHVEEASQN